eukprot:4467391-Amphidinium_carterae.1
MGRTEKIKKQSARALKNRVEGVLGVPGVVSCLTAALCRVFRSSSECQYETLTVKNFAMVYEKVLKVNRCSAWKPVAPELCQLSD